MTTFIVENGKYVAHLTASHPIFGNMFLNKIKVCDDFLSGSPKLNDGTGVVSERPIDRKDVLDAVLKQFKCFV